MVWMFLILGGGTCLSEGNTTNEDKGCIDFCDTDTETDTDTDSDADSDTDSDADSDADSDSDTDTGTTPPDTGDTGSATTAVTFVSASVACNAADVARYQVETTGLTSGGIVNAQDTANASPWNDEHDLESYDADPYGTYDNLERSLLSGVSVASSARNASTVFICGIHLGPVTPEMTFMYRVYDPSGLLADCIIFGHDPVGFQAGDYDAVTINTITNVAERASCTTLP